MRDADRRVVGGRCEGAGGADEYTRGKGRVVHLFDDARIGAVAVANGGLRDLARRAGLPRVVVDDLEQDRVFDADFTWRLRQARLDGDGGEPRSKYAIFFFLGPSHHKKISRDTKQTD